MDVSDFILHPNLAKKDFIIHLPLCCVLLEDNRYYPWIFLVPRKNNVKNMLGLNLEERHQLMIEMAGCESVMWRLFNPDQLNVAAIGNLTPQLHIHVICRCTQDPTWPETVWGKHGEPYDSLEKEKTILTLRNALRDSFKRL